MVEDRLIIDLLEPLLNGQIGYLGDYGGLFEVLTIDNTIGILKTTDIHKDYNVFLPILMFYNRKPFDMDKIIEFIILPPEK